MATFVKVADFVADLAKGVHNFSTHTFKFALSNTAPGSESSNPLNQGNGVVANVTQIAYTNVSGGQPTLDNGTLSQSGGTVTYDGDTEVITASGGAVPTFRYIYLFNDSATNKNLVGHWDYGSPGVTLADTESLTMSIPTVLFTLA